MGPGRRIEARANQTLAGVDQLVAKYQDGFTVEAEIEMTESMRTFVTDALRSIVTGQKIVFPNTLPFKGRFKITP